MSARVAKQLAELETCTLSPNLFGSAPSVKAQALLDRWDSEDGDVTAADLATALRGTLSEVDSLLASLRASHKVNELAVATTRDIAQLRAPIQ